MRKDLDFVELHGQLFLEGVNWGPKIDKTLNRGAKRPDDFYCEENEDGKRTVVIVHKGKCSLVETWAYFNPTNPADFGVELTAAPVVEAPKRTAATVVPAKPARPSAQVSDPTKQAPKTILRKAKYQGEESQGE